MPDTIFDRWDVTPDELTQVADQNPSLRGMLLSYLAELKLEQIWLSQDGISNVLNPTITTERRKETASFATREEISSSNPSRFRQRPYSRLTKAGSAKRRSSQATGVK